MSKARDIRKASHTCRACGHYFHEYAALDRHELRECPVVLARRERNANAAVSAQEAAMDRAYAGEEVAR